MSVNLLRSARLFARRLLRDRGGQAAMLYAILMLPMTGAVGVALDMGQWMLWRRQLHTAADMAALAGARGISGNAATVTTAVNRALANNQPRAYTIEAIEWPPTSGAFAGDNQAVRVVLSTTQKLPFSSIFMANTPVIRVSATAYGNSQGTNCILGLATTGSSVVIAGSASIDMNCGMMSNSTGSPALDASGSGSYVNASSLSAVGSILSGGGITATTKIQPYVASLADPFASVNLPSDASLSAMCSAASFVNVNNSKNTRNLTPGCYSGISTNGTVNLDPGTYYINGGNADISAGGQVIGTNVTLVFIGTNGQYGSIQQAAQGYLSLTAANTGTFAGIVAYQDRRATPSSGGTSGSNKAVPNFTLQGGGTPSPSFVQGAIYAPGTNIKFAGNRNYTTDCMQLVGLTVTFTGNTDISNNCPVDSGAKSFGSNSIRLVE